MEYQDKIDILEIRNKQYKQTLQEIKEIVKATCLADCTDECGICTLMKILQLIDKEEV